MKPKYEQSNTRAKSYRRVVEFKEKIDFSHLNPYASLLLLFYVGQRFCISYGSEIRIVVVFKFHSFYMDGFPCQQFFHLSIFIASCHNLYFLVAQANIFEIIYNIFPYFYSLRIFFQMLPMGANGLLCYYARISCLYSKFTRLVQIPFGYLAVLNKYLFFKPSGVLA